jgi:hypothetical protein
MPALAFSLKASSAVWKKVQRTLKSVADAFVESRMQRALIEIDRYDRAHGRYCRDRFEPKTDYCPARSPDNRCSDDHTLP